LPAHCKKVPVSNQAMHKVELFAGTGMPFQGEVSGACWSEGVALGQGWFSPLG